MDYMSALERDHETASHGGKGKDGTTAVLTSVGLSCCVTTHKTTYLVA